MIGDIEVLPEEQSEVDSQVFATDWDEFLEHVGNALQDQDLILLYSPNQQGVLGCSRGLGCFNATCG